MTKTLAQLTPSECEDVIKAASWANVCEGLHFKMGSSTTLYIIARLDDDTDKSVLTLSEVGSVMLTTGGHVQPINAPRLVAKMAELGVSWPVN